MPGIAASASYTWDDFIALDDDDRRELIDGELVEIEVPNEPHEIVVAMLCYFLTAWAQSGQGGYALASGYKVRISAKRGVMPDVQFYRRGNTSARTQRNALVEGRPDLVVEVISPSGRSYDRVTKLKYYASRSVPEYWIIDPEAQTVEELVLQGESYTIAASHDGDDVFRPTPFEGLEIPLAKLFAPSE
jgi:Uma2 family endonuclease